MSEEARRGQFPDKVTRTDELILDTLNSMNMLREDIKISSNKNADLLDKLLKREELRSIPLTFAYPDTGVVVSHNKGTLELDYEAGTITGVTGIVTNMEYSLDSQNQDFIRGFNVWADKTVIVKLSNNLMFPVSAGKWFSLSHQQFKRLKITTTETTNLFVIASTNPVAPLQEAETENKSVKGEKVDTDGTGNYFETDQAIGGTPTLYIQMYPTTIKKFKINSIKYYTNPSNAVTYELYLLEQASANDVQNLADIVFDSDTAQVDSTSYMVIEGDSSGKLPIVVDLADAGKLYYQLDWTGAPGNTPGYIVIRGEKLI